MAYKKKKEFCYLRNIRAAEILDQNLRLLAVPGLDLVPGLMVALGPAVHGPPVGQRLEEPRDVLVLGPLRGDDPLVLGVWLNETPVRRSANFLSQGFT